ncbi:MAG: DUF1640 domain-containing protein [Magnetococcales bacterium]|nr:DUF1640 domain-containing protein [Magnetococcales bacterium]
MKAIAFDTLEYANRLKDAGVPDKQTEAMAEAQGGIQQVNSSELATISGLVLGIGKLRHEIAEAKVDTIRWMVGIAVGQAAFIITILKLFPPE